MTTNIIDFADAKEKRQVDKDDIAPMLRELADKLDNKEVSHIFVAWTTVDGSVHYVRGKLNTASTRLDDDQLRLLGLLRLAERGFLDALTFDSPTNEPA